MVDHSLAGAVKGLNGLPLDGFLWHPRDMKLPGGGAGRLGNVAVVLLSPDRGHLHCGLMISTRCPFASNLQAPVQASATIVQAWVCTTTSMI
ncbi:hypothetical protein FP2506_14354 [Fulvimarina pelagi HTCC2506]|uniref:Uncharacterized protein n=2 Tax=Fulvimarina pelagi TaxID=217511 RepID=Q0G459_9HYPH|nr:hypothetical protein FP2506_14354 [Fulvimarina pelagi HTCC2506]